MLELAAAFCTGLALGPSVAARHFATCVKGFEPVLQRELLDLGAQNVEIGHWGVHFQADAATSMRATLWLRTSIRVMQLLAEEDGVHTADALRVLKDACYKVGMLPGRPGHSHSQPRLPLAARPSLSALPSHSSQRRLFTLTPAHPTFTPSHRGLR